MTSTHLRGGATRPRTGRARAASAATLALLLTGGLVLSGTPGHAQAAAADDFKWSVQPSGPDGPGSRAAFEYDLAPGETIDDQVSISNLGDNELTFTVYSTDAFTADDGAYTLLTARETPKDVGAWVGMTPKAYTVPPGNRLELPFTLTVPANADPGDHGGGIVASVATTTTNEQGQSVTIDQRVGARVYLRVKGALNPVAELPSVSASYAAPLVPFAGGPMTVVYTIRNSGNLRVSGTAVLEVKGPFGRMARVEGVEVRDMLPGAEVTAVHTFTGLFPAGPLTAVVTVNPSTSEGPLPTLTDSATAWGMPWLLLGLLVVIAGGAVFFLLRRRRSPVAPGTGSPTPDVAGDNTADGPDDVETADEVSQRPLVPSSTS